jgi:putative MFS transporter
VSSIYAYGDFLDRLPLNRRHWLIFALCSLGFAFDALDFQIMALIAPAIAREWKVEPQTMGFILSTTAIGMVLGSYLFGIVSDRIGRRTGFQLTVLIFSVFCGLSVFARNPTELAILRFFTGIGIGGFVPIDTAIMSEFMPKSSRGKLMALWAISFSGGGLIAAFMARVVGADLGWRSLFLVGAVPGILVLFVRMVIPESPRFLLQKGQEKEARRSIEWLALGKPLPPAVGSAGLTSDLGITKVTIRTLFSSAYRRRTTMLWLLWFSWSFSYFGVLLWLPSLLVQHRGVPGAQVFTYMMGFLVIGMCGRAAIATVVDVWGRKNSIAVVGVLSSITLLVFSQQAGYENLLLFGYLFAFFHDAGLSAIAPYTPELYPTRARATGVGYANGAGRIASIGSPIIVGFLVPVGLNAVFVVLAAGYLVAAIVVLSFGLETKGLVLEDAALESGIGRTATRMSGGNTRNSKK